MEKVSIEMTREDLREVLWGLQKMKMEMEVQKSKWQHEYLSSIVKQDMTKAEAANTWIKYFKDKADKIWNLYYDICITIKENKQKIEL